MPLPIHSALLHAAIGEAMTTLKIADSLKLPLDAVTEKFAWLGRTGSGKTYGAMKLAELMLEAGAQVGALDPIGVWRALRVPAVKDGASFEVVVFGGLYGDLPLEPTQTAGELVADLVCERGLSFVLDVSQFIPSEQQRFVRAFADRFFHRKKSAPGAVHLFMEECQEFIPENPSGEEAKTLGVMQRLWKLGRNFGIGGSLISQRPQEIAKKALNMSGTLFAFQMTGPQERKAVKLWVADKGIAVDIESVLQKLEVGQPHVESPMFLEVSKTVRILPRMTADLSSTPKVGASKIARRPLTPLTPIDVEQLKASMSATIEKAKADDPRELRKRIAELERLTKQAGADALRNTRPAAPKAERVEVPVLKDGQLARMEKLEASLGALSNRQFDLTQQIQEAWKDVKASVAQLRQPAPAAVRMPAAARAFGAQFERAAQTERPATRPPARPAARAESNGHLPPARQKILNGLAFLHGIGVAPADKTQLALMIGVSPTSGGYFNNLGGLRVEGLIEYPAGGTVALTDAGAALASTDGVPTTTDELHDAIRAKLPPAKWKILDALIAAYPKAVHKDAIAEQVGVSPTSGGFFNNLGSLRSLGLIDYPQPGHAAAMPVLFLEER